MPRKDALSVHAVYGVHPYTLRQRKVFRARQKPVQAGLIASVLLVMLFLVGFACGLRWIDQRFARPVNAPTAPVETSTDDLESSDSEWLTDAIRGILGIRTAYAAHVDTSRYFGAPLERTVVLDAAPGETVTVPLRFKNLGSAAWTPAGRRYVSAYTIQPRYHASVFRSKDWISSSQTPRLATASVKKGEIGELRLTLTAPKKTGTYSDIFQLASEDTSWIWGAFFTVKMNVKAVSATLTPGARHFVPGTVVPGTIPTTASAAADPNDAVPLKGSLTFRSAERIEAPASMQMTLRLIFRNEGDAAWKRHGLRIASFKASAGGDERLSDPGWASPELPVVVDQLVMPSQSADLYFTFTTPRKRGDYLLTLELVSDGAALASVPVELPIKVISDAPAAPPISETAPQSEPSAPPVAPSGEPVIRVGLYTTDKPEEIGSGGPFEARTPDGSLLASFPAGSRARAWYDLASRAYRLTGNGVDLVSVAPIRFVQAGSTPIFTVWSYENRPRWNLTLNDNMFRGTIEVRKNDRNDYVWVINELPIEQYLRGMAETSDVSPEEFKKALAVAARTYAYWHYAHPGKHWHFTVDATYDQVYRGYGAEVRLPKWSAAVAATRGQVVTYGGEHAVTPYFTWSDGRTRAWTEVWGGSHKPWLVSVPATYDAAAGRTLFGHGVGMSAWDAIGRANAGEMYDGILKYYYQGTELKKAY